MNTQHHPGPTSRGLVLPLIALSAAPAWAQGMRGGDTAPVLVAMAIILALVVLVGVFLWFVPVRVWIAAWSAGAKVRIRDLIGMRLRRVDPPKVVYPLISATKAGLAVGVEDLEAHYLQNGNVGNVVYALIAASRASIPLSFPQAAAIDLAGRDILDAVRTTVTPKVIPCPDPSKTGKDFMDAVSKDGIRLLVKAKVTVRVNLQRLVGGATEETIIARVGEAIVSTIGSSESYKDVLENPDRISRMVLEKGLASETAFEIVSIDIADMSVAGVERDANVGARLQQLQAEADKQIAQAKAEERRAMAFAREQEMRARVEEMRAEVVRAEAEVPRAIAEAFRSGRLGVMDYYTMKNVVADTSMREAIGRSQTPPPDPGEPPSTLGRES